MRTEENPERRLISLLKQDEARMGILSHLAGTLGVPEAEKSPEGFWIGAGFVRSLIWDHLAADSRAAEATTAYDDIDVLFFEPRDTRQSLEQELERKLHTGKGSGLNWSVRNQARMHQPNRDMPYRSIADAMKHWPEVCTALAARLNPETQEPEILAPFGLDDVFSATVRPTPHFREHKLFEYRIRQDRKQWQKRWPLLKITDL
ncbi:nucleotidyltransferase family protein [Kiloniella sp. b19]|uniref:nucleotidyltransferase family protein n=1 Tax=Kiloniella sp. GXU_MW_B19 TaxID=3141326 RepID=UPI0031DC494A